MRKFRSSRRKGDRLPKQGSFAWCVEQLDLGDPILTRAVQETCDLTVVWPEQMLGRSLAGQAVSSPHSPPLATGHSLRPRREGYIVLARREAWFVAYQASDWSVENIAETIGGYHPATVRPFAMGTGFAKVYGNWWQIRWQKYIEPIVAKFGLDTEKIAAEIWRPPSRSV